ncbi:MAG TPA: hypothetical protein ENK57_00055, partial [Polyangiaceae bacterium]|nr:hypothetical protein [Polyangiaceae bacterium]
MARLPSARATAVFVAVLAAAWVADLGYFSHGYTAHWYQPIEGQRVLVDRTTEHRVVFPNVHRALSRYVQGWPSDRYGVPPELPVIDVVLRARIEIPGQDPMRLSANALSEATIWADGEPLGDRELAPGPHDLWIRWQGRPRAHRVARRSNTASFELTWKTHGGTDEVVPASALTPADGAGGRGMLWALAFLLAALFGAGVQYTGLTTSESSRRRRLGAVLALGLVVLGVGMRGYDYDVMPEYRENSDELFATWNGWSLLEDGSTRGWTAWAGEYSGRVEITNERAFGMPYVIISPYFEHPPLMHLLVGAAAQLGGAHHYMHAKLRHTRLVPIGLMAVATLLMVAVGRRLWPGSWSAWVGALLFNVVPSIVLQTRVIKEEDLLVPLLLGAVLFFLRWRDDGRRTRDLVGAAICVGLAPLAKVPAAAFIVGLAALFASQPRGFTAAARLLVISLGLASLLAVYAVVVDWDNFIYAQRLQSGRAIHWSLFSRYLHLSQINHNHVGRGWTQFLWVGYAVTVFGRGVRETAPITVPPLVYLVALSIGTGNWNFGWYIVQLYPFLCLGAGDFIVRQWRRPSLLGGLLLVGVMLFYSLNLLMDPQWAKNSSSWGELRLWVS